MTPKRLLTVSLWGIIILLVLPLYLRLALINPVDFQSGGIGAGDFRAYFVAARLLDRGEIVYDVDLQQAETAALGYEPEPDPVTYLYPSFLATTLLPLRNLSLETAARLWNLFQLILLIAAIWLLSDALDLRAHLGPRFPWFILLFTLAAPTTTAIRIGQANVATLFFVMLALWAAGRDHAPLTGAALAVATLLKVFPIALLVWFIWRREWRVVRWFVAILLLLIAGNALFLAATGRDPAQDWHYLRHILPDLAAPRQRDNQSLLGFLYRFDLAPGLRLALRLLFSALIGGLSAWLFLRLARRRRIARGFALILTVVLLLSTITWTSTLIFLVTPVGVLLEERPFARKDWPLITTIIIIYLLLNGIRLLFNLGVPVARSPLLMALPFYATLLVWISLAIIFAARENYA